MAHYRAPKRARTLQEKTNALREEFIFTDSNFNNTETITGSSGTFATTVFTCTIAPTSTAKWQVGSILIATGMPPYTKITSLGTGTGGTGTYNLSNATVTQAAAITLNGYNLLGTVPNQELFQVQYYAPTAFTGEAAPINYGEDNWQFLVNTGNVTTLATYMPVKTSFNWIQLGTASYNRTGREVLIKRAEFKILIIFLQPYSPEEQALTATCSYATSVMTCTVAPTVGTFQVGMQIFSNSVAAGTIITSLGTGTGGTGTYNLSTAPGTLGAQATYGTMLQTTQLCPNNTVHTRIMLDKQFNQGVVYSAGTYNQLDVNASTSTYSDPSLIEESVPNGSTGAYFAGSTLAWPNRSQSDRFICLKELTTTFNQQSANQMPTGIPSQNGILTPAWTANPTIAVGGTCSFNTTVMTCTIAPTQGSFQIGMIISALGIATNTYIISLGTGTGGTGTYTLSATTGVLTATATYGSMPQTNLPTQPAIQQSFNYVDLPNLNIPIMFNDTASTTTSFNKAITSNNLMCYATQSSSNASTQIFVSSRLTFESLP